MTKTMCLIFHLINVVSFSMEACIWFLKKMVTPNIGPIVNNFIPGKLSRPFLWDNKFVMIDKC